MSSLKNRNKNQGFIKIGQLAQKSGVFPSTVNFYTSQGLLKSSGRSQGGYRLYEPAYAIAQIKKIQKLQTEKRLTIEEIKRLI